ncbi:hypothetical protein BH23GEM3_BH23GEM3_25820 [soil metagenome]
MEVSTKPGNSKAENGPSSHEHDDDRIMNSKAATPDCVAFLPEPGILSAPREHRERSRGVLFPRTRVLRVGQKGFCHNPRSRSGAAAGHYVGLIGRTKHTGKGYQHNEKTI